MKKMMVRWMCGVILKNRITSDVLRNCLSIEAVTEIVRRGKLRWFGHVERKVDDDWVNKCTKVEVVGKVGRGRGRKTWLQCVNSDMKDLGLRVGEAQDRQLWRRKIFGETSEPCVHGKTDAKH